MPTSPPVQETVPPLQNRNLSAIHFVDAQRGWVVGDDGTILHTTNGGQCWNPQASGTQAVLMAVHMQADGQCGLVVGVGTILLTADGGATWRLVTYGRTLAPWYYLSLLGVLLLLVPALKHPESIEAAQTSVADVLISDRPLEAGEPDPLGFNAVAMGLSRFLRNENTQPPLTIAITGEWGTGKSSLMNLLRADLAQNGFCPVWFNAWHHQKEEHLLASLLENIRAQAVPPWWHSRGARLPSPSVTGPLGTPLACDSCAVMPHGAPGRVYRRRLSATPHGPLAMGAVVCKEYR